MIHGEEAVLNQNNFQACYRDIRPLVRPHGQSPFRRVLLSAGAVALGMAVSGQALADVGSSFLTQLDQAVIEVDSDGENYTAVDSASPAITGRIGMSLNAEKFGRIKSWALWPSMQIEHSEKKQFPEYKYAKSYPLGDRPKRVDRDLPFSIPLQAYKTYAKDACNLMATRLRNFQGKTNEQIFATDRSLWVKLESEVTWKMSGIANETPGLKEVEDGGPPNPLIKSVTVKCKKAPPPPIVPPTIAAVLVVQGYDPVNAGAKCQLKLEGSLVSSKPNVDVTYRYVDGKGKESDLKTLKIGKSKSGNFAHSYPLGPGEKTGKIRIVGENLNFTSPWKNYSFECGAEPTNDLQTLLPPQATLLEVGATATKVKYKGHICPVQAKMIGAFKGRGTFSGRAVLRANLQAQKIKPFSIKDGDIKYVDEEYDLQWKTVQGPLLKTVKFELILLNATGGEVDRLTRTETFACEKLNNADSFASVDPKPKTVSLTVGPGTGMALQSGYSCPSKVLLTGNVQNAQHALSGNVAFFANGKEIKQEAMSLGGNSGSGFSAQHDLDWTSKASPGQTEASGSGPAMTKQTIAYAFKVFNSQGAEIGKKLKTKHFACVKVASIAGSITKPPSSNRVGQVVVAKPAISILEPRNRIRNGKIRLSGVTPNQMFSLSFLRKTASGYKLHNSAQLPKQMTGVEGSFNLEALDGGDWRLNVCETNGDGQFVGPQKCKHSDFYLPNKKKPQGKVNSMTKSKR